MVDEIEYDWYEYEDGRSVGRTGPEGGLIRRDEELGDPHDPEFADARLTLEQRSVEFDKPFALTAQLYGGWLQETFPFDTRDDADRAFDTLKDELYDLADLIPDERARDIEGGVAKLNEAIAALLQRYTK